MRALLATLMMTGLVILGCSGLEDAVEQWAEDIQPVPPPAHHAEIVGVWQSSEITLVVGADGLLEHEEHTDGTNRSFNAPILEWSDDGFTAGIGPIKKVFRIDTPPARLEGVWTMSINGTVLTRQE